MVKDITNTALKSKNIIWVCHLPVTVPNVLSANEQPQPHDICHTCAGTDSRPQIKTIQASNKLKFKFA